MRTIEKRERAKGADNKAKVYKTADEAFQTKHDSMKALLKKVDLSQLEK